MLRSVGSNKTLYKFCPITLLPHLQLYLANVKVVIMIEVSDNIILYF